MARKKDFDYFVGFTRAVDYSCQAARILSDTLENFDSDRLPERIKDMHGVEHAADIGKHEVMSELARAFITPIDREDILQLMQELDDVTDNIEDVLIRTYIFNIVSVREDAIAFAGVISQCCDALLKTMKEFRSFRKSGVIHETTVEINRLEEEGDALYTKAMRRLFMTSRDPIELMIWREIYERLEKCCDACEHVANIVESIIMKNS
ncbi:MAG: DUF47 domain-containing protein [Clostridiales bacterium]|jgi:predicted phosphate transport protein (TIGR00153 family)|nr:DUF47 domain-containing protein [Clostridiales bacterium]